MDELKPDQTNPNEFDHEIERANARSIHAARRIILTGAFMLEFEDVETHTAFIEEPLRQQRMIHRLQPMRISEHVILPLGADMLAHLFGYRSVPRLRDFPSALKSTTCMMSVTLFSGIRSVSQM